MFDIIKKIAGIVLDNEYDDDFIRPDSLSIANALALLPSKLPMDCHISTVGEGDLRFEWSLKQKRVHFVVKKSYKYLYFSDYSTHLYNIEYNVTIYNIEYNVTTEKIIEALAWLKRGEYQVAKEEIYVIRRNEFERMVREQLDAPEYSIELVERVEDGEFFYFVQKVNCEEISEYNFVSYYESPGMGQLLNHFCYNGLIEEGKYLICL